jgi:hypothetical protein
MSPNTQKITFTVVALAVIGVACLAFLQWDARRHSATRPVTVTPVSSSTTEITTEEVIDADGWKTHVNKRCGVTYRIPADWISAGWLSDGVIIIESPADIKMNEVNSRKYEEYLRRHPEIGPVEGGSSTTSSLVIDCQPDLKSLLSNVPWPLSSDEITKAATLAGVFDLPVFRAKGSLSTLVKTVIIDEQPAYEVRQADKSGHNLESNYAIFVEKGKIFIIRIGNNEYDKLSSVLKQIIESIKLS